MKTTDEFEHMILEDFDTINNIKANTKSGKIMLNDLIRQKNISISKLSNDLGMSTYLYEVLDLKSTKKIGRNKLISILISLNASIKDCNEILQKFAHSKIYAKVEFDAIIYYCIHNNLSLQQTNELLIENNYETL